MKMMRSCSVAALAACAGSSCALADLNQNMAVNGNPTSLLLVPQMRGITGNGVVIAHLEAGGIADIFNNPANNAALLNVNGGPSGRVGSLMPNGNPNLPGGQFRVLPFQGYDDHATIVAGCMVSRNALQPGLSPQATINAGSFATIGGFGNAAAREASAILNSQELLLGIRDPAAPGQPAGARGPGAHIINYSWGLRQPDGNTGPNINTPNNDGTSTLSRWVDYAARAQPGSTLENILYVVAGNETPAAQNTVGSPSDAYNILNVAATGRIDGVGNLVYDQYAAYNRPNRTSDGRMGVHLVAPGGDPGNGGTFLAGVNARGTLGAPPTTTAWNINNALGFCPTVSGQLNSGTGPLVPGGAAQQLWLTGDANRDGIGNDPGAIFDTTAPNVPGPLFGNNPGYHPVNGPLNNADAVRATSQGTAGTSFAAPLVSSAAALLTEAGARAGMATDQLLLRSVMMTGASKWTPGTHGGAPTLQRIPDPAIPGDPATWTRAGLQGVIPLKSNPFPFAVSPGIVPGFSPINVGLDSQLGAGQLDLTGAANVYFGGQHGPGPVPGFGWDQNTVASVNTKNYFFWGIGGQFTATLVWDLVVDFAGPALGTGLWEPGRTFAPRFGAANGGLIDLDLLLWRIAPGGDVLIDYSTSQRDNVEHLFEATALAVGDYRLEVRNIDARAFDQPYALSWAVPAPSVGSTALAILGLVALRRRRDA